MKKATSHNESDHQDAMESLRRAIALKPNLAVAHQRYAWVLSAFGHLAESVREMRRARELDPLSHTNNTALGLSLIFARQYPEALIYCGKAVELAPGEGPDHENLAFAYAVNGMFDDAIKHYQIVGDLDPDQKGNVLAWIAEVLVEAGRQPQANSMMPEILKLAAEDKTDPYNIAALYGVRGEKDAAFEWFNKALASTAKSNGHDLRMIRYDPMLDSLRGDDRFATLLRQHDMESLCDQTGD